MAKEKSKGYFILVKHILPAFAALALAIFIFIVVKGA